VSGALHICVLVRSGTKDDQANVLPLEPRLEHICGDVILVLPVYTLLWIAGVTRTISESASHGSQLKPTERCIMKCSVCGAEQEDTANCSQCGAVLSSNDRREITAKLDPAALEEEWRKRAPEPLKAQAVMKLGAKTDLGRVRENNEDKYEFYEPEDEEMLAARGFVLRSRRRHGRPRSGQIASELALKTIINSFYSDPMGDLDNALTRAFSKPIRSSTTRQRRSSSVRGWHHAHRGCGSWRRASRNYRSGQPRYFIRDGRIHQLTHDHSWVSERSGSAHSLRRKRFLAFRNVITRSLGAAPGVEPDIYVEQLQENDVIVLCSDGLSGNVLPDEILKAVEDNGPSAAAKALVELANERGGNDNITVFILKVADIVKKSHGGRLKRLLGGK